MLKARMLSSFPNSLHHHSHLCSTSISQHTQAPQPSLDAKLSEDALSLASRWRGRSGMLDGLLSPHSLPFYRRVRTPSLSASLLFSPAPLHRNISINDNPAKVEDYTSLLHGDSSQPCLLWTGLTETYRAVPCSFT